MAPDRGQLRYILPPVARTIAPELHCSCNLRVVAVQPASDCVCTGGLSIRPPAHRADCGIDDSTQCVSC